MDTLPQFTLATTRNRSVLSKKDAKVKIPVYHATMLLITIY